MSRPLARTRAIGSESGARPSSRTGGAQTLAGAVACALCCVALPFPAAAVDSDFTDFRIPKNRALLWTGGLSARANGSDFSNPSSQSSSGSLNGDASTRASWFSDSDPAFTSLDVDLQARGLRGHQDQQTQVFAPTSSSLVTAENADRVMIENWALNAGLRRYPWAVPFGIEALIAGRQPQGPPTRGETNFERKVPREAISGAGTSALR
jgi:hypothetical protein